MNSIPRYRVTCLMLFSVLVNFQSVPSYSNGQISEVAPQDPKPEHGNPVEWEKLEGRIALEIEVFSITSEKLSTLDIDWQKKLNTFGAERATGSPENLREVVELVSGEKSGQFAICDVNSAFGEFLKTLVKNQVAKLDHDSRLGTLNGQQATFEDGNEIPFKLVNKDGVEFIEFKTIGTKLFVKPKLDVAGTIWLEIVAEESEVATDLVSADGTPGFRVRRVNSGVRLAEGQSVVLVMDFSSSVEKREVAFLLKPRHTDNGE